MLCVTGMVFIQESAHQRVMRLLSLLIKMNCWDTEFKEEHVVIQYLPTSGHLVKVPTLETIKQLKPVVVCMIKFIT